MRALVFAPFAMALVGCSVAISGAERAGPGGTSSATAAATSAHAGFGSARVAASFGAPPPAGAPGGRVRLTDGAAAVLVLGLVLAEGLRYLGAFADWPAPAARPPLGLDPRRPIAHTCSCYGYQPETDTAAARAVE